MKSAFSLLSLLPWHHGGNGANNAVVDNRCSYNQVAPDRTVNDQYRVLFHEHHTLDDHFEFVGQNLSETAESFVYVPFMNGYRAQLSPEMIHDLIRHDPGVEIVEHNTYRSDPEPFHIEASSEPLKHSRKQKKWTESSGLRPWYLRMTNAGRKLLDLSAGTDVQDKWYTEAGQGVNIYIIDSGIRLSHEIFGGRAKNLGDGDNSPYTGSTWDDTFGHGTHVAGIAALQAPAASIVNVKVLDANVTVDDTIQAINDVIKDHQARIQVKGQYGSVINMSMAEENTDGLRRVIASAIAEGIPVVTSAGNSNSPDATIPCGYPDVVCVAACNADYKKWANSNYGELVTIVAPGESIISASIEDDTKLWTMSGTSQAAPSVAGILSHYVGYERLANNVDRVYDRVAGNMIAGTLSGFLTRSHPTVNHLINTGFNSIGKIPSMPYFIPFGKDIALTKVAAAVAADAASSGPSTTMNITTSMAVTAPAAPPSATTYFTVGSGNFTIPDSLASPLTLSPTTFTSSEPTATKSTSTTSTTSKGT